MVMEQTTSNSGNLAYAVMAGGQVKHLFADSISAETYAADNSSEVIAGTAPAFVDSGS
jgi:hypothetical protein